MYDNKKIFILGMARSGYQVAKLLHKHGCEILITDMQEQDEEKVRELSDLGINLIITSEPENLLDDSFSYVVKNPGIKLDHKVCLKAKTLNIPVINEVEVAYHYLPNNVKIIGITGSNGKTTTTTLTYEFLKEDNKPVHLGGNIGYPFSSLIESVKENDIIVLELSAQQLHDFDDFKVNVAVLTNLTEVHLDHFKTYEYYKETKKRIFRHQDENDVAVLNQNDLDTLNLTSDLKAKKLYFARTKHADAYIENNYIYYKNEKIINIDNIKIKGNHNYENIMAAIIAVKQFNVSNEAIVNVLETFTGVSHRLQFVKNVNRRDFYNDSKATNVKSTTIALSAFNKPTILLLGGLDRGHLFDGLLPYMKNVKKVICYGETKERILEFCNNNNIDCEKVDVLKEAVNLAYKNSVEGDVILLSPACASWDQYKKFEDRGDDFIDCVNRIGE